MYNLRNWNTTHTHRGGEEKNGYILQGWEGDSVVKSICCSWKIPDFSSQCPHIGSHPLIYPAPQYPMPSCNLRHYKGYMIIFTHAAKVPTHIKKWIKISPSKKRNSLRIIPIIYWDSQAFKSYEAGFSIYS